VASGASESRVNVFLIYDREEFEERGRPAFQKLLDRAREHTWGARLFVVLTDAPLAAAFGPSSRADMKAWMSELVNGRVADVIQMTTADGDNSDAMHVRLRDCASVAIDRKSAFCDVIGRPWLCAIPAEWGELARIVGPNAITEPDSNGESDLLIVVGPPETDEDAEAEIERYLVAENLDRRYRVVTHMHWPSKRFENYCRERNLGTPVVTAGDFELWYLLLRLNADATMQRTAPNDSVHTVPLSKTPRLRPLVSRGVPVVLVTIAFDSNEEAQWFEAARDVGEFLRVSPHAMEYHVELFVNPQRLNGIVNALPVLDGWIHMGHCSADSGLWLPDDGDVVADRWTQCFHGRELRVAIFLTCDSHQIARHFAEQGAGVAIGFEGKVDSTMARQVAMGLLNMIRVDVNRGSMLEAFRSGEAWYGSAGGMQDARPRAYHPRST
jgi:hypothetical protein